MKNAVEESQIRKAREQRKLIVIGSSAGGPKALRELLSVLDVACPVIVVQHMPQFINYKLVETLSTITKMKLKLAENSEKLSGSTVYIAPSDFHLKIRFDFVIELVTEPLINFVRPAIDATMQSISLFHNTQLAGVILTGMGKDGAAGISHFKSLDALTIAQDPSECSVSSMPEEAIKTQQIDKVQTLKNIGITLNRWAEQTRTS